MINSLFLEAIGFYNMPMASFFICEVKEILKLLEKMKNRIQFEHELMYIAICNALGKTLAKTINTMMYLRKKKLRKKKLLKKKKKSLKITLKIGRR